MLLLTFGERGTTRACREAVYNQNGTTREPYMESSGVRRSSQDVGPKAAHYSSSSFCQLDFRSLLSRVALWKWDEVTAGECDGSPGLSQSPAVFRAPTETGIPIVAARNVFFFFFFGGVNKKPRVEDMAPHASI